METKQYEVVECECGHVCPVVFAHLDADGIYTCPDCVIEELTSQMEEAKPVSSMLPDGFWFDNENGTTVTVVGVIGQWCLVSDPLNSEPYILPFEFVASIYEESKEVNSNGVLPCVSGSALLPEGFRVYKCPNCGSVNVKRDNGEIRVGFCDECEHPIFN